MKGDASLWVETGKGNYLMIIGIPQTEKREDESALQERTISLYVGGMQGDVKIDKKKTPHLFEAILAVREAIIKDGARVE